MSANKSLPFSLFPLSFEKYTTSTNIISLANSLKVRNSCGKVRALTHKSCQSRQARGAVCLLKMSTNNLSNILHSGFSRKSSGTQCRQPVSLWLAPRLASVINTDTKQVPFPTSMRAAFNMFIFNHHKFSIC